MSETKRLRQHLFDSWTSNFYRQANSMIVQFNSDMECTTYCFEKRIVAIFAISSDLTPEMR